MSKKENTHIPLIYLKDKAYTQKFKSNLLRQFALFILPYGIMSSAYFYYYAILRADYNTLAQEEGNTFWLGVDLHIWVIAIVILILMLIIAFYRARYLTSKEKESDHYQMQLLQASKLASVGELAAGIAHEINNPLAVVLSELGLIKDLLNPQYAALFTREQLMAHIEKASKAAYRMQNITSKMLSYVRFHHFQIEKFDVVHFIDDLIDNFYLPKYSQENIKFTRKYISESSLIQSDENILRQIVINILNNAVDAITPPGEIIISINEFTSNIEIAIADTGCGMSKEELENIFLPFYTTKHKDKGTGLGLAISFELMQKLDGDIKVESMQGGGSIFKLILPYIYQH
jgi:two-component system, NtrC family, sensor kinase